MRAPVTSRPSSTSSTSTSVGASATSDTGRGHAGQLEDRVGVVALQDPAVASGTARPRGRVREHRGDRPLAVRLVEGSTTRRRSRRPPRRGPSPAPSSPGGRRGRARAPEQPVAHAARSPGPGHSASARRWASCGVTRCRVTRAAAPACPTRCRAIGIVTGSRAPSPSGSTTQTPSPHAVQVPSTSVSAGPPLGPVSPGTTRRTTTRCPTTCGPSVWARSATRRDTRLVRSGSSASHPCTSRPSPGGTR